MERQMDCVLRNGVILTGRPGSDGRMEVIRGRDLVIRGGKIGEILSGGETTPEGCRSIDVKGGYILPGLINMHVHLVPASRPRRNKKKADYGRIKQAMQKHPLLFQAFERAHASYARQELYSGVTTIRTVGGVEDLDGKLRDRIRAGQADGPRIICCNTAISVPGGHMAGLVATESASKEEALADLERIMATDPDWIKLMVTGGVLDAKVIGEPGVLRMSPEIIAAVCDRAHAAGFRVCAHAESPEGVKAALANGVDTIEHGAKPDEEMLRLFRERGAADICTISPAILFEKSDTFRSVYGEEGAVNGTIVSQGIIACARACIAAGIPVGLGTDAGCPFVMQYDMWRELVYFARYCGVSSDYALCTATYRNAQILGISDLTGSIERGKAADLMVTEHNPLEDLRNLQHPSMVMAEGRLYRNLRLHEDRQIRRELDGILNGR